MRSVIYALSAAAIAGCGAMPPGPYNFGTTLTQQSYDDAVKYVTPQAVQSRAAGHAQATFTGQRGMPTLTVTGQYATPCQYRYNLQVFVRLFVGDCPYQIPIQ